MNEMDMPDFEEDDLYEGLNSSTNAWWNGDEVSDKKFSLENIRAAIKRYKQPILKEREQDKHPPYYPYNTFAPRDNNCQTCHAKVIGAGWYFRFLHVQATIIFCQNCFESSWKNYLNNLDTGKRGIAIHGALSEKIGNEIIKMLQGKALTN